MICTYGEHARTTIIVTAATSIAVSVEARRPVWAVTALVALRTFPRFDGNSIAALDAFWALASISALSALGPLGAICTIGAIRAIGSIHAVDAVYPIRSIDAICAVDSVYSICPVDAIGALRPFRSFGPFRTIDSVMPLAALRALDVDINLHCARAGPRSRTINAGR